MNNKKEKQNKANTQNATVSGRVKNIIPKIQKFNLYTKLPNTTKILQNPLQKLINMIFSCSNI